MDPFHERLARVALDAAGIYGFALAGGYAIQAHGLLSRMSSDVDLFAPPAYAGAVIEAYRRERLTPARTVELLHDTIGEADLPDPTIRPCQKLAE